MIVHLLMVLFFSTPTVHSTTRGAPLALRAKFDIDPQTSPFQFRHQLISKSSLRHAHVRSLFFLIDPNRIAALDTVGVVRIWDWQRSMELARFRLEGGRITSFAPVGNGRTFVAGGSDGTVYLIDALSTRVLGRLSASGVSIRSIAVCPSTSTLAVVGDDGNLRIIDLRSERVSWESRPTDDIPRTLAFSNDGTHLLLTTASGRLLVLHANLQRVLAVVQLPVIPEHVTFVGGTENVSAVTRFGELYEIKLDLRQSNHEVTRPKSTTVCSPLDCPTKLDRTGVIYVAFSDGRALLVGPKPNQVYFDTRTPTAAPIAGARSFDGRLIAIADTYGAIHVWELATGRMLTSGLGAAPVSSIALARDGSMVAVGRRDGSAAIHECFSGRRLTQVSKHGDAVTAIAFGGRGSKVVASAGAIKDGRICIWNTLTGATQQEIASIGGGLSLAIDKTASSVLSVADKGGIGRWDTRSGKLLSEFIPESAAQSRFALSDDDRLLAVQSTESPPTVRIWDITSGREVGVSHPYGVVKPLRYSPRGTVMCFIPGTTRVLIGLDDPLMAFERHIQIWDYKTGQRVAEFGKYKSRIDTLCVSPDARTCVVVADGRMEIWEVQSGQRRGGIANDGFWITAAAMAANGGLVATGHIEGTVALWPKYGLTTRGRVVGATKDKKRLWDELASSADVAFMAMCEFSKSQNGLDRALVKFVEQCVNSSEREVECALNLLDDPSFAARSTAYRRLADWGDMAEDRVRAALKGDLSAEKRERCEQLLVQMERGVLSKETARLVRAIEVLEDEGDVQAAEMLRWLSTQSKSRMVADEARRGLLRLKKTEVDAAR